MSGSRLIVAVNALLLKRPRLPAPTQHAADADGDEAANGTPNIQPAQTRPKEVTP